MATHDQILVPESLLKKRKSQEKARNERNAIAQKKKAVSWTTFSSSLHNNGDDNYDFLRLDQKSMLSFC